MYGYYRYGFNGKEIDNEVYGAGNQQDYGMRIYDPRLGRFLSTDPITDEYPELTPYQFASNTPIQAIDLDGLEGFVATGMPMGKSGHGHGMIVSPQMVNNVPYPVKRIVTDFTPFVGTGLGLYEAFTGNEVHSKRPLAVWERGLNIVPIVGPLRKTYKAINAVDNFKNVAKTGENLSDANKTLNNLANAPQIANATSRNRGLGRALEKANNSPAQAYENSAIGASSDVSTKYRLVPTLKYDNPNPRGFDFIKFDGYDEATNTLIDRKLNVTGYPKSIDQINRAAEALSQNPSFKLEYQVPLNRQNSMSAALRKAGQLNNQQIKVTVVKP
jgi:RHS repeat-associated protein